MGGEVGGGRADAGGARVEVEILVAVNCIVWLRACRGLWLFGVVVAWKVNCGRHALLQWRSSGVLGGWVVKR